MIKISISKGALKKRIEEETQQRKDPSRNWITTADEKTKELADDPKKKVASIWSDVKPVFMELQAHKCIFCEKKLEDDQKIEQDVEHFRPKNNVRRWRVKKAQADLGVQVKQPKSGNENGYRLLAYNYLNYAASCKTCNTTRKKDYFPIAGKRKSDATDPTRLGSEKPLLLFPLGDWADDPEEFIEFVGVSPQAKKKTGHGLHRALVTIELFQLDQRKGLRIERAECIYWLHRSLVQSETGTAAEKKTGRKAVAFMLSGNFRHTNCLRCFKRLYDKNKSQAASIASDAFVLFTKSSPVHTAIV